MHNIIFTTKSSHEYIKKLEEVFEVNTVKSIKAAIIYQIEFPAIDAIIYDSDTMEHREILDSIEKINLLNPMILQLVIGSMELDNKSETMAEVLNDANKIIRRIESHGKNRRKSNRASWPINAKYHNHGKFDQRFKGVVLSISTSGCYIKTGHLDLGSPGDKIDIEIFFEDFNFLVEGEIVRIQRIANLNSPQGFSVKFIDPTPQTKSFIDQIINNRILSMIFSDFNHLEGSLI